MPGKPLGAVVAKQGYVACGAQPDMGGIAIARRNEGVQPIGTQYRKIFGECAGRCVLGWPKCPCVVEVDEPDLGTGFTVRAAWFPT